MARLNNGWLNRVERLRQQNNTAGVGQILIVREAPDNPAIFRCRDGTEYSQPELDAISAAGRQIIKILYPLNWRDDGQTKQLDWGDD